MTPVPRVYLPISLTAPGPSGSAEPTRLCRGRSHQHRRSTAPAASSSTPPLRRRSDGWSLTSIRTPAPRGALEQVAGEDGVRLGPQELAPRWSGPPRRRVDAGVVQDGPDGGGADLVAEAGEFAVDASISPCRVLGGQAEDQGAQAGGDGWSPGPGQVVWSSVGRSVGGASAGWWPGCPAARGGGGPGVVG